LEVRPQTLKALILEKGKWLLMLELKNNLKRNCTHKSNSKGLPGHGAATAKHIIAGSIKLPGETIEKFENE
jgi:hypothetical protein